MIKDVIVSIDLGGQSDFAVDFAISVAAQFGANITGVAFIYEAARDSLFTSRYELRFQQQLQSEIEESASAAIARFERAAQQAGVFAVSQIVRENWLNRPEAFAHMARRFDLAVLGQRKPDQMPGYTEIIEAAMFDSGRPVLLIPYIQKEGLRLGRVMVCWDGSRAAARAVGDAMPFLTKSKAVDVVVIANEPPKSDEIPGFDIASHLARHGVTTKLEPLYAPGVDTTAAVLNRAEEEAIDLIVMGGYGHSRFREVILGGVTRGILATMTVPVLLSH